MLAEQLLKKFRGEARGSKRKARTSLKSKTDISRRPTRFNISRNVEYKFVDSGQVVGACDTTGSITLINVIPQGSTTSNRIGKKCMLTSVQIHGFFYVGATAVANNMGALLVFDRQSNGAAIPAITDIMTTVNTNDFANDAKIPRYKILRRWDCVVMGATTAATGPSNDAPTCNINDYIKLNKKMEFNTSAATGVQATIEKGAMYIVTLGSSAAGTTAGSFQYYTRTRFTEDF